MKIFIHTNIFFKSHINKDVFPIKNDFNCSRTMASSTSDSRDWQLELGATVLFVMWRMERAELPQGGAGPGGAGSGAGPSPASGPQPPYVTLIPVEYPRRSYAAHQSEYQYRFIVFLYFAMKVLLFVLKDWWFGFFCINFLLGVDNDTDRVCEECLGLYLTCFVAFDSV